MQTNENRSEHIESLDLKYNRALDDAGIVCIADASGVISYANKNFCTLSLYTSSELMGQNCRLLNSTYHSKQFFSDMWATISAGKVWREEIRNKAKDGSVFWLDMTIVPLIDEKGSVIEFVSNSFDITDRKQNEEPKFQMLFEHSYEGLLLAKPDGSFLEANDAFCRILGYERDELLKLKRSDILVANDTSMAMALKLRSESGHYNGILQFKRKDGSIIDTELSSSIFQNLKGESRTYVCIRDITESLKAKQALLDSEKKFRALIENSKDGIALTDSEARFLYVSPAIESILGYTPEELIGEYAYNVIHADFQESNLMDFFQEDGIPKPQASIILKVLHKNGDWKWIEASVSMKLDDPSVNAVVTNFRDVTDKKNTEEVIRNNERRFRSLIENSKDGIALSDADRKFIYISPAITEILGYEPEELIRKYTYEFFVPEEQSENLDFFNTLVNKNISNANKIIQVRHKNGGARWVEITSTNKLDDPSIGAIVTNFRDVTDRKNTEQAVLHNEKKFRALIENSKDGICLSDSARKFIYISPAITDILGYEPEELIGTDTFAVIHPDEWLENENLFRSVINKNMPHGSQIIRVTHKNGSPKWIEITAANKLDDPSIGAIVTNFRDVTDRKNAEEALLNSEKRYRALIENHKEGLALTNRDRKFTYITPSIINILGYQPEELIGMAAIELYHTDDQQSMREMVLSVIQNPHGYATNLIRVRHKDGSWRWIELTATNQFHDPAVDAMVTNFRDVTERKKAEDELELLNESLEKKVEERTQELIESNRALESFSYLAAHDLQAPLRGVSGYASILKQEYPEKLGTEGAAIIDIILQQTKNMTQLIADLLNFSRVSHTMISEQKVDLDEMVSDLSDRLSLNYSSTSLPEIKQDHLGSVSCDPALIRQVWSNLISNALKYSSKREKPVVEIGRDISAEGEMIFYVKDNGAGFDMKNAPKLFQVFQRLHSMSEFEGNGVGLALVKNIVTRHGGRVWTEAEPDKGATFYFSLPN